MNEKWSLYKGTNLIGTLTVTENDMPWLRGDFEPLPEFEIIKPLFDLELLLVENDQPKEWELAYKAITNQLSLQSPDKVTMPEFILHIDGPKAWWRYNETPFES